MKLLMWLLKQFLPGAPTLAWETWPKVATLGL